VISRLGKTCARALSPYLRFIDPSGGLGNLLKGVFDFLHEKDSELRTGGLDLPPLTTDQARQLAVLLHAVSERPLLLILDAVDQLPNIQREAGHLHAFLEENDSWPPCHVVLGVRQPGVDATEHQAYEAIKKLEEAYLPLAQLSELGPMDLTKHEDQQAILKYLRKHVHAARSMTDEVLLANLEGYAGTLIRWVRGNPDTPDGLLDLAIQSRIFAYPEFRRDLPLLRSKNRPLFDMAVSAALLPEITSEDNWKEYRPASKLSDVEISDLAQAGIFESPFYPTYGHTQRYKAFRDILAADYPADQARQAEQLIIGLASSCRKGEPSEIPRVLALASFSPLLEAMHVETSHAALSRLTAYGLETEDGLPDAGILKETGNLVENHPEIAAFVSIMLFNSLIHAKAEEELPRRDALLDELRALQRAHPEDPAVRERLAKGLFNTLVDAKAEEDLPRRDALLDELRALLDKYTDTADFMRELLMGIVTQMRANGDCRTEEGKRFIETVRELFPDMEPPNGAGE